MKKKEIFDAILTDRNVRQKVVRQSHVMFFNVYFPHYVKFPLADFHKEIFRITEDERNKLACIVAFRGSGKSTLITFSYAVWSILGVQRKKFVMIICQTQAQARQHMANLKHELEHNALLKSDLGPFHEETGGNWAMSSLVFENTGARITIASIDQSIRGIRHYEHRPDLLILDDVEDINSTKTLEGRDKIYDWFTREVIPLGDVGTRTIIVGNLLHEDSLVMRLKKRMDAKQLDGTYRWFPLLDADGKCLWPGKFDMPEKIESLRRSVANELAWQQEYLLTIISDTTRVVYPEWIHRYGSLPQDILSKAQGVFIGVDLAISQKTTADYTSLVTGILHGTGDSARLYILPNPVNKRMNYPEAVRTIADHVAGLPFGRSPAVILETNGFQEVYGDLLKIRGVNVIGIKNTSDKRSRLALASYKIQTGMILFPEKGADDLITQLTGFGIENHDDLSDAFSIMANEVFNRLNGRSGFLQLVEEDLRKLSANPRHFENPASLADWVVMAHRQRNG